MKISHIDNGDNSYYMNNKKVSKRKFDKFRKIINSCKRINRLNKIQSKGGSYLMFAPYELVSKSGTILGNMTTLKNDTILCSTHFCDADIELINKYIELDV